MEAGRPLDCEWGVVGVNLPVVVVAAEWMAAKPAGTDPPVVAGELMVVDPRVAGT